MDAHETEFLKRLRATFRVEAEEHLHAMSSGLLALEKEASREEAAAKIEAIFRHAHSLKGAARAVNLAEIESLCQTLESLFAAWKRGEIRPVAEQFDALHRALDWISKGIPLAEKTTSADDQAQFRAVATGLNALMAGEPSAKSSDRQAGPAAEPSVPHETAQALNAPPAAPEKSVIAPTVRLSTSKLDQLLSDAEEMLAVKLTTARRAADLRELQPAFDRWRSEWAKIQPQVRELQIASARQRGEEAVWGTTSGVPEQVLEFLDWSAGHFRSLEGKLQALGKVAGHDLVAVGRRVEELRANSKQLLMLPFSTLLDLFPKLVRDLSREQGKEADLVVRGGDVEMDKRILEEMKDALIHLVRNGIDHGIEKPEARARQNKASRGTITIAVSQINGSKVEILVSDDGAGIDPARVREAALKRGMISADQARQLDEQQAFALVFQSEISTSPIITEVSGRGLGLAIVREKTERLGGRVTVESRREAGATFRIVLPTSLATFRGIQAGVAGQSFVIPTANVERVARVKSADIKTVENRETISLEGQVVSLVRMDAVLEMPRTPVKPGASDFVSVVLLAAADERIAFAVDEVLDEQEVLVKPLAKPLVRVRNISGATILGSGRVVPILNVADLMKSARKTGVTAPFSTGAAPRDLKSRQILVVEDSITSRMLLKNILESAGYVVKTAVDGIEAMTELRTGDFDLVVSDIEMPRMNGFDLTAQIRADRKLADKPVVLVTALASREDRERGVDVGANAYIVKSSFDQSNLLEAVRRLV